MKKAKWGKMVVLLIPVLLLGLIAAACAPAEGPPAGYAGSEACLACHGDQYNWWRVSGHPYKLRTAEEAQGAPVPLPEGYTWDDITYVIGGYKWKSRYVGSDGYIITGDTQYNMATGEWVAYHTGEQKPYDCGRCHTTGYSAEGHQGGLEGIVGTWAFGGIQCEECHGPGADHTASADPADIEVDTSAARCGDCHVRGSPDEVPAKGGFIRHHEQYNELLASEMSMLQCVSCHDPHKRAELSIETDCAVCHSSEAQAYAGSTMDLVGIDCIECHMPYATKSAVAVSDYKADVRTHLFAIDTDPEASMFNEDGTLATGYLTVEYACLGCHIDKDKAWALEYADEAMTLGK